MVSTTYWMIVSESTDVDPVRSSLTKLDPDCEVVVLDVERRPRNVYLVGELLNFLPTKGTELPRAILADAAPAFRHEPDVEHDQEVGLVQLEPDLHIAATQNTFAIVHGAATGNAVRMAIAAALDIPGLDPPPIKRVRYLCLPSHKFHWLKPGLDGQDCPHEVGRLHLR